MKNKKKRDAYFVCCLALKIKKKLFVVEGRVYGSISKKILGKNGFGFDPIFIPKSYKITFGQMLKSKKIKSKKEAIKNMPNLLFLKGKTFRKELNDVPENFNIKFQTFPSITSAESRILLYSRNIL